MEIEADPPAGVTTLQKGPWNVSGCAFPGAAGGGAIATSEEAPGVAADGVSGFVAGAVAPGVSGALGVSGTAGAEDAEGSVTVGEVSARVPVTGSASRAAAGGVGTDGKTAA